MRIDFTGRGVDISDQIRSFTISKMERLKKHLDDIQDVSVVLSVEKYRHKTEIKFLSHKRSFHGDVETSDMFQSIDQAITKLETQVKKFKEKQNTRKRNTTETIRVPDEVEAPTAAADENEVKIIRQTGMVKPMSTEEAVDELEKLGQDFVLFRDADSESVNLVYRLKDGNVGLIEASA